MRKIEINPMTRLEGHGKIAIFLDDDGNVDEAFFQVVEFRGFEKFLVGLPIEEVPRTVSNICGVCRGVHFTAAMKASDGIYGVEPPPLAKKLRELFFNAHYVEDHAVILYALGLPDFVVGPDASPADRNIVGLIQKVGAQLGRDVLKKRGCAVKIFELLGGKPNHPVAAIPGGWSKTINELEREKLIKWSKELVDLGKITIKIFEDIVLKNKGFMDLVTGDMYKVKVNYLGSTTPEGKVSFYDGTQKMVDVNGKEICSFSGKTYLDYIAERVLPWSYLKMPYQKKIGWQGICEGEGTSLYCVGPLARMNVANGMDTPLADAEFKKFFETLGGKPVHQILAYHWARAIELLNAAEKCLMLAQDPEITGDNARGELGNVTGEGVGIVEAPRGTLIHHYNTDDKGIVTDANLVVATTHNKGPINLAVRKAAKHFVRDGNVDEAILNHVEMAFRPYDLCLGCATHAVKPGVSAVEVEVYNSQKKHIQTLKNF
ncbi:MAG: Ni/Fe hydrogenase subunit alpha [Desulfobacter sp.]|nr:MAG: Ni/Fe hydrogenase subunit alpha [Desulfobacter sp.]